MFLAILIAIFTVLIGTFIIAIRASRNSSGYEALNFCGVVVSAGLLLATAIIWPITYFGSVNEVTKMEAFYHDTLDAYEYTVAATGNIEITNAEAGLIDVAYNQQGAVTSERLRELRDKIEWFNAKLRHYERFNNMFIADPFLADLSSDLVPITLGINTGGAQ